MSTRKRNVIRILVIAIVALGFAELGIFGCNAILGNNPGVLVSDASTTTTLTCDPGKKGCAGVCSAVTDPAVGCSGSCTACATPANGTAGCTLEDASYECAIAGCNDQYADCDSKNANGCETHTTTRAHCGSCNGACTQQFCERQTSGTYECSNTCDAPNKTCPSDAGAECTDPQTDNDNCGGCGTNCTVANGAGTCKSGKCAIVCNANYFLCNGVCTMATASQCGASCASCGTGTVCDVSTGSPTYGTCVTSTCTQTDTTCGPKCLVDCTTTGDKCVNGACTTSGCTLPACVLSDGGCTNDTTTDENCGFCNNSCDPVNTGMCCCGPSGTLNGQGLGGGGGGGFACRGTYDGTGCACAF